VLEAIEAFDQGLGFEPVDYLSAARTLTWS
jgi:hypothetical protein